MKLNDAKRKILAKWWWQIDRYIITCIIALMILGLALLMAASTSVAERIGFDSFYFLKKQVIFLILGSAIMVFFSSLSAIQARRLAILGFLGCFILLVGIEFIGYETKGAKRWIRLMGFSLQPSEIIKPFFAVLNAWILTRKHTEKDFPGYIISFSLLCILTLFIIRQPDLGMTVSISIIWFTQLVIGGLNIIFLIIGGIAGIVGIISAYFFLPHVQKRIDVFLDSSAGDNFQTNKSLQAFENGGIFGTGPGQGRVKEILPDAHTDFIFSVAGEEFGLFFCILIIALYGFLITRCFYRVFRSKEIFLILALTGLTTQIFFQSAVNMGVAVNLLPNTGMTLPFISYGGSSMISLCFAAGLILCFTKKKTGL